MSQGNISVGDIIIWWENGNIGIFLKKVEMHAQRSIASRNFNPKWTWLIEFNDPTPIHYNKDWGVREDYLLTGDYGKIYRQKK